MKRWGFLLVVFVAIGYLVYHDRQSAGIEIATAQVDRSQWQSNDELSQENKLPVQITQEQIYQGSLLLVNRDHPVRDASEASEAVQLSKRRDLIDGFVLLDPDIRLSPSLLGKFTTMIEAAAKEGVVHFMISSGYRDEGEQSELYEQMGPDYALPAGYSEHNLGLSLDIGSTQGKMEHADEGKWLEDHAWEYGFILRYPKNKTAVTGIQNEPWHFRYVGLPHSAIMHKYDFVLEEYLDYLKQKKSIAATIGYRDYQISYYPISRKTTIPVPADRRYDISGNNVDGVVVTVYPGSEQQELASD